MSFSIKAVELNPFLVTLSQTTGVVMDQKVDFLQKSQIKPLKVCFFKVIFGVKQNNKTNEEHLIYL